MLDFFKKRHKVRNTELARQIKELEIQVERIKNKVDVEQHLFDEFQRVRHTKEYLTAFSEEQPLVTICIATYNRGKLLLERSVKSVLSQDYSNIELIVVGDHCTDDTSALVATVDDPRLIFINLPQRGVYPENPDWRWMVAGTTPVNHALQLARGQFITHLDDDDEFPLDRIGKLVGFAQQKRADFIWHPFWKESATGEWELIKAEEYAAGFVTTSSVFYHQWFRNIPWDVNAYRYQEAGDWNRFRKIKHLAPNTARFPEPQLRHYKERNQKAS